MNLPEILFVDDEREVVEPIASFLQNSGEYECQIVGFDEAEECIRTSPPDVVVLDLVLQSEIDETTPGLEAFDFVWKEHFCPVIIHTGFPEQWVGHMPDHPFVRIIKKGSNSQAEIQKGLHEFRSHVETMRAAEMHIRRQFAFAVRELAPFAFTIYPGAGDVNARSDLIVRGGRRRLAALMDDLAVQGDLMFSWEQYIFPSVGDNLLMGDILRLRDRDKDDPTSFCIVLTPSCDMVRIGKRAAKVDRVLVSHCISIEQGLSSIGKGGIRGNKLKDLMGNGFLVQGHFENVLVIPEFIGQIPHMFANLRDLELVPWADLDGETGKYERVASLDSPFRELVAWAYMEIACRPGLPDRDIEDWCAGIMKTYSGDISHD